MGVADIAQRAHFSCPHTVDRYLLARYPTCLLLNILKQHRSPVGPVLYLSALGRWHGDSMAWHMIKWHHLPSCWQPNVGDLRPPVMAVGSQTGYPHTFRMVPNAMCKDGSPDHSGCSPLQLHSLLWSDLCGSCIIQLLLKTFRCLNLKLNLTLLVLW